MPLCPSCKADAITWASSPSFFVEMQHYVCCACGERYGVHEGELRALDEQPAPEEVALARFRPDEQTYASIDRDPDYGCDLKIITPTTYDDFAKQLREAIFKLLLPRHFLEPPPGMSSAQAAADAKQYYDTLKRSARGDWDPADRIDTPGSVLDTLDLPPDWITAPVHAYAMPKTHPMFIMRDIDITPARYNSEMAIHDRTIASPNPAESSAVLLTKRLTEIANRHRVPVRVIEKNYDRMRAHSVAPERTDLILDDLRYMTPGHYAAQEAVTETALVIEWVGEQKRNERPELDIVLGDIASEKGIPFGAVWLVFTRLNVQAKWSAPRSLEHCRQLAPSDYAREHNLALTVLGSMYRAEQMRRCNAQIDEIKALAKGNVSISPTTSNGLPQINALVYPKEPIAYPKINGCQAIGKCECGRSVVVPLGEPSEKQGQCSHVFRLERPLGRMGRFVCTNTECALEVPLEALIDAGVDLGKRYSNDGNTLADAAQLVKDECTQLFVENAKLRRSLEKLQRNAAHGKKR